MYVYLLKTFLSALFLSVLFVIGWLSNYTEKKNFLLRVLIHKMSKPNWCCGLCLYIAMWVDLHRGEQALPELVSFAERGKESELHRWGEYPRRGSPRRSDARIHHSWPSGVFPLHEAG